MSLLQSILLGIVQGVTEFLPVSSSAHLIILPNLFEWDVQPLAFDVVLHFGTLCALIFYFKRDIYNIIRGFYGDKQYKNERNLGIYIVIGSIPAVIVGYFFGDVIESMFRGVRSVISFLVLGSVLMYLAERYYEINREKTEKMNYFSAFVIGVFQSLALFSGISRSGATISGGMFLNLSRSYSARFSFLLSIPAVLGATLLTVLKSSDSLMEVGLINVGIGFFFSFIFGIFAIDFLIDFLKKDNLKVFIIYRIILAVALFIIF